MGQAIPTMENLLQIAINGPQNDVLETGEHAAV